MVLTFLLGLTFLLTQVIEYHRIGFNTSDELVRGHVLRSHRPPRVPRLHRADDPARDHDPIVPRPFQPRAPPGVEIGGIYWHFVDVMWIIVYVTVYLL